jgi:hypothetical protein
MVVRGRQSAGIRLAVPPRYCSEAPIMVRVIRPAVNEISNQDDQNERNLRRMVRRGKSPQVFMLQWFDRNGHRQY